MNYLKASCFDNVPEMRSTLSQTSNKGVSGGGKQEQQTLSTGIPSLQVQSKAISIPVWMPGVHPNHITNLP